MDRKLEGLVVVGATLLTTFMPVFAQSASTDGDQSSGGNGAQNQQGGGGFRRGGGQGGGDGQGAGRAAFRKKMLEKFDTNHDGVLDDAEKAKMREFREQRKAAREAREAAGQGGGGGQGSGAANTGATLPSGAAAHRAARTSGANPGNGNKTLPPPG